MLYRVLFWSLATVLVAYLVWITFNLQIEDLYQALAEQHHTDVATVQRYYQQLLVPENPNASAVSSTTLALIDMSSTNGDGLHIDTYANHLDRLWFLYRHLLWLRITDTAVVILLVLPWTLALYHDYRKHQSKRFHYTYYTAKLQVLMLICSTWIVGAGFSWSMFTPYASSYWTIYSLMIAFVLCLYLVALHMTNSSRYESI